MSRRRWVQKVDIQPGRVVVTGWRAGDFLKAAGLHPLWLASANGWVLDRHRAADAVAALEISPAALLITGEELPAGPFAAVRNQYDGVPQHDGDLQLDLFGDAG